MVQPRFYGADGAAEHAGDLRQGSILEEAQHDNLAMRQRQTLQTLTQAGTGLVFGQRFSGGKFRGRKILLSFVEVARFEEGQPGERDGAALSVTNGFPVTVQKDGVEPG